ncbi:MAG: glycosyltransferase [bacterium]|nr:glycosyltransferase [bacterium]
MTETARRKLLIVITKSNFGGAQRYVFDLARSLKDKYDIVVACGSDHAGNGLLVERLKSVGVRVAPITSLGRDMNLWKDFLSLLSLIKIVHAEKPDIVHLNSAKAAGLGAVARLIAHRKARSVFTAHAWAFNEDRNEVSRAFIAFFHWLTIMLAHKTIAVSEGVKRQVEHMPKVAGRIQVVHLGIDKPIFYGKKNARTVLGIPEKVFSIGTIAELHKVKGLAYALDGMKSLPFPFTYTIVGTGDLKDELAAQIAADPKLKESVRMAGFIPDAATLIPAFDVFLLPSLSEAFGYVLLESGYANVPVIATSVGGIPEIIEDMRSGALIHAKQPKEITQALRFAHDNVYTMKQLGGELNRHVNARFSVARMVSETETVYDSLLAPTRQA